MQFITLPVLRQPKPRGFVSFDARSHKFFVKQTVKLEEIQLKQSMCQLFTSSIYSELSVLEEPRF